MGTCAFMGCESLESITIPSSITKIEENSFRYCFNLENVVISNGVKSIGEYAFAATGLKSIIIPNSVTNIWDYAFGYTGTLTNVVLSNELTNIGEWAFYNTRITNIIIPNGVKSIGKCAFAGMYYLESITIPNSVQEIDETAFKNCKKLVIITKRGEYAETFAKENNIKYQYYPYKDVQTTEWYASAVEYVYNNNIIKGYDDTTFAPNDKLTRGQLVTILHRMEGLPEVIGTTKFPDVQDSKQYYYKAVKWATDNKIVSGYNTGKFGPDDNITREQLAVILNKYTKYKGKNVSVTNNLSEFKDANKISSYAISQMKWAVGAGVITGNADKTLKPQGTATRAEASAMLYKYCTKVK